MWTADPRVLLATVGALAVGGLALQWSTYLNHDIAWILYSTRRMLNGAVFGRDVIAANPPLAWFLSMPAVVVSNWSGWPVDAAFRVFVAFAAAVSLAHCYWSMRGERPIVRSATVAILAYLLFVSVGRDFGQREHLSLIFVLPYLVSSAARAEGRDQSFLIALLTGIAAGLGIALKPYFLMIPFLVELFLLRTRGMPRLLVRPEIVAIAATGLLYVAAVIVVTPEYLTNVVPLASKVYWGFENSPASLIMKSLPAALALGALIFLRKFGRWRAMTSILCAGAIGYAVSYFLQSKGYSYHAMPMIALAIAASVHQIADLAADGTARHRAPAGYRAIVLAVLSLAWMSETAGLWYWQARPGGSLARELAAVIATVNAHARGDSFLAISTHPFPGFPTAIYAESAWAGRTNSQIALPAVIKLRELGSAADSAALNQAEALARSMFLRDLSSARPAVLLVDVHERRHAIGSRPFDFLGFYRADPSIDAILQEYREMPALDDYRVFVRSRPS